MNYELRLEPICQRSWQMSGSRRFLAKRHGRETSVIDLIDYLQPNLQFSDIDMHGKQQNDDATCTPSIMQLWAWSLGNRGVCSKHGRFRPPRNSCRVKKVWGILTGAVKTFSLRFWQGRWVESNMGLFSWLCLTLLVAHNGSWQKRSCETHGMLPCHSPSRSKVVAIGDNVLILLILHLVIMLKQSAKANLLWTIIVTTNELHESLIGMYWDEYVYLMKMWRSE